MKGELDRAIADYDAALRLNPEDGFAHRFRGDACLARGDYGRAVADFGVALRMDSADEVAYRGRGNARLFSGELDLAMADFNAAVECNPESARAYYGRGVVREVMGDSEGARMTTVAPESWGMTSPSDVCGLSRQPPAPAPLAEADGVILFSGLASNPDIASAGDYIFRTQISDVQVGIDTGNVLWADGVRKLATITETTDYAEGVRRTSVEQFEKRGGAVVAAEGYGSDVADFRSQLTKLLAADPDALHIAPQSEFAAGTIIKQARELGYEGPIYAETISVGTTALEVGGEATTGMKAITADLDLGNKKGREVLANFRERYDYVTLPWHLGSAYDDVYIAAECLKQTNDDQDADGFRDCMYGITWSGAIGDSYSFDASGEVVGLSRVVVEVLPVAERTAERKYKVLGPAPRP